MFFTGLKSSKLAFFTSFDDLGLILNNVKAYKPGAVYQQTIVV
jgi:hypothetical protein